jgi:hypothetical protein
MELCLETMQEVVQLEEEEDEHKSRAEKDQDVAEHLAQLKMESESESSDDIGKRIVAMTLPLVFALATGYVFFVG